MGIGMEHGHVVQECSRTELPSRTERLQEALGVQSAMREGAFLEERG